MSDTINNLVRTVVDRYKAVSQGGAVTAADIRRTKIIYGKSMVAFDDLVKRARQTGRDEDYIAVTNGCLAIDVIDKCLAEMERSTASMRGGANPWPATNGYTPPVVTENVRRGATDELSLRGPESDRAPRPGQPLSTDYAGQFGKQVQSLKSEASDWLTKAKGLFANAKQSFTGGQGEDEMNAFGMEYSDGRLDNEFYEEEDELQEGGHGSLPPSVIYFHRVDCPNSQKFEPVWNRQVDEQLQQDLPGVTIIKMTSNDERAYQLARAFGVTTSPTIGMYRNGKFGQFNPSGMTYREILAKVGRFLSDAAPKG